MKPKHSAAAILCLVFGCLAMLFLSGCAGTTFYDRKTGKVIARFQGNMTDSRYRDGSTSWDVAKVDHSTPTRAGGSVIGTAFSGAAGVLATYLTGGMAR